MKRWLMERLLAVWFPERCAFCGEVIRPGEGLCPDCRRAEPEWQIQPPVCPFCGRETAHCFCGKHRRHFERCVSAYTYAGAARQGIFRLKDGGRRYSARYFAARMAEAIRREYGYTVFAGIVPVPSSPKVQKRRGYNPSLWLAEELSRLLQIPVADVLVKLYETRPQKELPAGERAGNLLGVFDLREGSEVEGRRFLLVDDVITTGSTLDECAKMLKIYGAVQVLVATAGATRYPKDGRDEP